MSACRILTLHGIGNTSDGYGISHADYSRVISLAEAAGWEFDGMSAIENLCQSNNAQSAVGCAHSRRKSIVLTYDDAYESILQPISEIGRRKGLIFPIVNFIGKYNDWNRKAPCRVRHLSWSQLRSLVDMGIDIGSHTCSHWNLERLDEKQASAELLRSRAILEDGLGVAVRSIAYPYGEVSPRIRALTSRHYQFGFVTSMNIKSQVDLQYHDALALPRETVSSHRLIQFSDR